jgi:hypothetical protein
MQGLVGKGMIKIQLFISIGQKSLKMSCVSKKFKNYFTFAVRNSGRSAAW